MAIPCPGTDTYSQIFGVGRNGPNPFVAFLRAFVVLLLELARSASLRRFLAQDCDKGCDKSVTGPAFSRFTVRIRPRVGGGWTCVMGGLLEAQIDCTKIDVEASLEDQLEELLAYLQGDEPKRH